MNYSEEKKGVNMSWTQRLHQVQVKKKNSMKIIIIIIFSKWESCPSENENV